MAAVAKDVEQKIALIRRAPTTKPKTKSAGAIRKQRERDQKKYLERLAETHRTLFFEAAMKRLADETPKGRSSSACRWIGEAWLKAGRLPPATRKYLAANFQ